MFYDLLCMCACFLGILYLFLPCTDAGEESRQQTLMHSRAQHSLAHDNASTPFMQYGLFCTDTDEESAQEVCTHAQHVATHHIT
jgi:hypothetical protein